MLDFWVENLYNKNSIIDVTPDEVYLYGIDHWKDALKYLEILGNTHLCKCSYTVWTKIRHRR